MIANLEKIIIISKQVQFAFSINLGD